MIHDEVSHDGVSNRSRDYPTPRIHAYARRESLERLEETGRSTVSQVRALEAPSEIKRNARCSSARRNVAGVD